MAKAACVHLRVAPAVGHDVGHRGMIAWKPVGRTVTVANLSQRERLAAAGKLMLRVIWSCGRSLTGRRRSGCRRVRCRARRRDCEAVRPRRRYGSRSPVLLGGDGSAQDNERQTKRQYTGEFLHELSPWMRFLSAGYTRQPRLHNENRERPTDFVIRVLGQS